MIKNRLKKIINFWKATEKFKLIERVPCLSNLTRRENDAEHSWHLALMIMTLRRELEIEFDELRALKIAIVHDLPEVYTLDTWVTSDEKKRLKKQKELLASKELFGILPGDLEKDFFELWQEYEKGETVEAKIVKALDKICYPLQYTISKKIVWQGSESLQDDRRAYAHPYTKFNQELTNILDQLLEELENSETTCIKSL